jgi:hypothetical protein
LQRSLIGRSGTAFPLCLSNECGQREAKCPGEPLGDVDADVALAAFNKTHIGRVNVGALSECLLSQTETLAVPPNHHREKNGEPLPRHARALLARR